MKRRSLTLGAAGAALSALGVATALFAVHQSVVTDVAAARSQHELREDLRAQFVTAGSGVSYDDAADGADTLDMSAALRGEDPAAAATGAEEPVIAPDPPREGAAVALLRIPSIGLEQVVVEGTSADALKGGPGHFRSTPMPGEPGNSAIAAHRTTYGAPFADLDRMHTGDDVFVTTRSGRFHYVVTDSKVVSPGEPDVLSAAGDDRLTLTTSHPAWIADSRLVVTARLDGLPVESASASAAPLVVDGAQLGLSGDAGAWSGILLWGELLAAAGVSTLWAYRHRPARSTYVLSAPVLTALAFLLFESVDRLLPATL